MPTNTFDIDTNIAKDSLAECISEKWNTWMNARQRWEEQYRRVLQYLYSTTTDTIYGQASNPWAANVHIPKLTQLRDVLITYELESLFSLDDYFEFEGFTKDSNTWKNRNAIKNLLKDMLDKGGFRETVEKLVTDYIDAGNVFVMPVWETKTVTRIDGLKSTVWEGSKALRINPLDIVFDPTAQSFEDTPKIIRTVLSIGQVAAMAEKDPMMKEAFKKAMDKRQQVRTAMTNGDTIKSEQLEIAGFGSIDAYLLSDTVELLTLYGTVYDIQENKLHENTKITIMDRNTLLKEEPMEELNGYGYIRKGGYRDRKDMLWSMSPLENLLGMQARIDFLENKRSDCYDFVVNPIKLIRGQVDMPDTTAPGDEIRMDADSDVRYLAPDTTILSADNLIALYENKMEEFVGSPKEVLGLRTPGEKTMYEVSQLLTAAQRIFQRQIRKFETEVIEPFINDAFHQYLNRKAGQTITLRVWDSDKDYYKFEEVSVDDIQSIGAIRVIGSTTHQERSKIAASLQMLGQNPLFTDEAVRNNFSPSELGQIFMYISGLDKFPDLFRKDSRLYEITEQQKLVEQLSQQVDEVRAQGLENAEGAQQQLAMQRMGGVPVEEG